MELSLNFNQSRYYPGEMVRGYVTIKLNDSKKVKGVDLKIRGKTKFQWSESEKHRNPDGSSRTKTVVRRGKETYLKSDIQLLEKKTTLNAGEHTFPFAVMLPTNIPSTFTGTYGGISYYGIVRINVPFVFDKLAKNFFLVNNALDLNLLPSLMYPVKVERIKKFCCCCCTSAPLTLVVRIPKTGYSKTESIPITVEVDNASRVAVDNVTAFLNQRTFWVANSDHSKSSNVKLKKLTFGAVADRSTQTWSKTLSLLDVEFPANISNCKRIIITYELKVVIDPNGAHSDLIVEIPLTIGDIPFYSEEIFAPPFANQCMNNNSEPPPPYNQVVMTSRMGCVVS